MGRERGRTTAKPSFWWLTGRPRIIARFIRGGIVGTLKEELKDYDTSKGAIRFPPNKPLPSSLVKRIVKLRIAQNEEISK